MKTILIVILIAFGFICYLFQHRYSIKCTQEIAQLEKDRQLLKEEITRLETEQARTFLWVNLENSAQQLGLVFPKNNLNREHIYSQTTVNSNYSDSLIAAHRINPDQPIHHE